VRVCAEAPLATPSAQAQAVNAAIARINISSEQKLPDSTLPRTWKATRDGLDRRGSGWRIG
jgi:hypothetical protein